MLNIRNCVDELSKNGVSFKKFAQLPQDESGVWCAPSGALVVWFTDPDGNTLSLTDHWKNMDS
ncbi:MAG: hypothetical protein ACJA0Z_001552 [Halioglobus sp.]